MATYRHLPFFVILASTVTTTRAEARLVKTKYSQCLNKLKQELMEQSTYETPCPVDIDRLQVYYDNVTDTLIGPAITPGSKHVILPVT
jgi:hypothetical protein